MHTGQIIKALSGFYYIKTAGGKTYQTRARGIFRKNKVTPLVGDYVEFSFETEQEGRLEKILERKNSLIRPAVSNIDLGVIIMSTKNPDFSTSLLDRFLVSVEKNDIKPLIYVTKTDIIEEKKYNEIKTICEYYRNIGYSVILPACGETIKRETIKDNLESFINGKTVVFMGQSGAGKSTLLNKIDAKLNLKTAETSKSLGRGKHTTRHVELISVLGGLIADTPGFSAIQFDDLTQQELILCFPEIWENGKECRFKSCIHLNEPNCAVKKAVEQESISEYRYKNYVTLLDEIQKRKPKYGKKGEK
ncbi:MAG: ribosome small subunit-dependent GTPase A [Alkalibacterium gilvum]|uniref:Small ribosomal subunit biogenesis GTPase RsgA n=1 Tax=Alkalibacterium gilvum TaxID=1130080 RepID=A0A1H6R818_9LACT|nr:MULTISPECIES: ribosome small subunit-dependent GTPase A [Alkalibacterium]MDN6193625.1 ribosome small subunit-dependent GTPase A [Alkalibacterium sp.]MDN6293078.1 ribosome small subunit-dependent GTPase A [Alkalibacterium sp.]MDN6294884.1 ribosome small subunit-dependent GTPase A [Alkalibacterium sp.]MDN6385838.1 ribosome small subunit-dependent GTPase A [Alkalibacterium sp.]MDN6397422.1 ribosome small subunit-dependent GTPase A [Alkalibacterium sp.]